MKTAHCTHPPQNSKTYQSQSRNWCSIGFHLETIQFHNYFIFYPRFHLVNGQVGKTDAEHYKGFVHLHIMLKKSLSRGTDIQSFRICT